MSTVPHDLPSHHGASPESGQILTASAHEHAWTRNGRLTKQYQAEGLRGPNADDYTTGPRGVTTFEELDRSRRVIAAYRAFVAAHDRQPTAAEVTDLLCAVDSEIAAEIDTFYAYITDPDRAHDLPRESL